MSLLRTSTSLFSSVRAASSASARTIATSAVRRTDDPNVLNKDTHSGASVKADKHGKDPKTLQKEPAEAANSGSGSSSSGASGKHTSTPNDSPTHSEDAVHGDKHNKGPEELQKETTKKMHG